ncbi:hypothetical protein GCM10009868_28530 [Terrabacter aerolatus]|uniref:Uncharacterized protein n=1 Tax=Terrabacter aerolatus TaxID=422442 RepID=A0A512CXU6_9MICO|nr:hypothetical protein [Terrabacter aerolatus]GEO28840.1 hypothetical protein TAE01_06500 [Terrabacter aerolatus]
MEKDDVNPQTPAGAGQSAADSGYIGRHARPGKPDQGPDEDATYDARHDDVDGPPGATQA